MSTNSEIIKKYFDEHPATAALAQKYGLKEELIVVDAFADDSDEERLVLNDECFDKFLDAYLFSYSEEAKAALKEARENGKPMEISAALLWMDKNFDKAVEYHMENVIKKYPHVGYNYVNLSRIIANVIKTCSFAPSFIDYKLLKKIGTNLKKKYDSIIWGEEDYDMYRKLCDLSYNPEIKSAFNIGVSNCLKDESLDILTVLKTLKNVKSFLDGDLSKSTQERLLKEEIDNLELNIPAYIPNLYNRLYREGKLEEVINNPDEYIVSKQLATYKKEEDERLNDHDIVFEDEDIVDSSEDIEEPIPSFDEPINIEDSMYFINPEIIKDVEICFEKYVGADLDDNAVFRTVIEDVVASLFNLDKDIYNPSSSEFNIDTIVNSIMEAFTKNGLYVSKDYIHSLVINANYNPISTDMREIGLIIDEEIVDDFKALLTPGVINKFNTLRMSEKEVIARDLINMLLSTNKEKYNTTSKDYSEPLIIDSIYYVLKDYYFKKNFVEDAVIKDDMFVEDVDFKDESTEDIDNKLYNIFNFETEKNIKSSLEKLNEKTDNKELFKNSVLKAYSNLINACMYGTVRDIEMIEKQFNVFCSENDIDYTDEFINSLPEIIRDRYTTPIVRQEQPEKKKGEVFKIVRRYIPKTSVKTQKRIYASIAGVGIISFLFMTAVKVISPDTAADSCTESFARIFHSDLIGNIFGDIKTYFLSIAASAGGVIGYVAKDEKENKSRRM